MMTVKMRCIAGIAVLLVACMGSTASGASRLNNLMLQSVGEFVELTIPAPGHQLCRNQTVDASENKPFRIVIDVCGSIHAFEQHNYADLPASVVKRIRTSQYAADPEPVVRIVLDLKQSATYTVRQSASAIVVAIADPAHASFADWDAQSSTNSAMATAPAAPRPMASNEQTSVSMTTRHEPESVPTDKASAQVMDASKKKSSAMAKANSSVSQPTAQKTAKDMSSVQKTETKSEHSMSATGTSKAATADKSAKASASMAQAEPVPSSPMPSKHMAADVSAPMDHMSDAMASDQSDAMRNEMMTPSVDEMPSRSVMNRSFVLPNQPLVLAPSVLDMEDGSGTESSMHTGMMSSDSHDMGGENEASGQQHSSMANEAPVWASTESQTARESDIQPFESGDVNSEMSLIDRLKMKFFGNRRSPKPYITTTIDPADPLSGLNDAEAAGQLHGPPTPGHTMDRSALLDRIREAEKEAAQRFGQMKPLPQEQSGRQDIVYDDMGRRDPFEQLLDGLRSGFMSESVPNVENLRMVGVLRDDYESLALLEDMEGHSYILRAGDPVENGQVLGVQAERVIFRVNDYGWLRTVALQLSPRGADPSKALGANAVDKGERIQYEEEPEVEK